MSHETIGDILHIFDLDQGIEESGRSDNLLDDVFGVSCLILGWSRRNKYSLSDFLFKFLRSEGAIFKSGGESESIVDEIYFPSSISRVHSTNLRDGDMGFIDEGHEIFREKVDERGRTVSYFAPGEEH